MAHNDTPTVLYQRLDQWTDGDKLAKTLHHRTRPLIAAVPYHDQDPTDLTLLARRFNHVCDIVRLQWDAQRAFNQAAGNQYITPGTIRAWRPDGRSRYWRPMEGDDIPSLIHGFLGCDNTSVSSTPARMPRADDTQPMRQMRERVREQKRELERLRALVPDPDQWSVDWRERLDYMVRYRWLQRIPAAEKPSRPLPAQWRYADSFEQWPHSADRWKTVDVMVEVLLGLDTCSFARGTHPLRAGTGAGMPTRTWHGLPVQRTSISRMPSAPRLGHVVDEDGMVVFLDVTVHDDLLL